MLKKTLVIALTALLVGNVHAKVTFEDAVQQDADARAYNNSINKGAPIGGLNPEALEENSASGEGWKPHWTGSTTGSISVPHNAKEVFVKYTLSGRNSHSETGMTSFPVNAGGIEIARKTDARNQCRATAVGTFSNHRVNGQSRGNSHMGSNCTAYVSITNVMYR